MSVPAPEVLSEMLANAITGHIESTPRSQQKAQGLLGPSDLGFCRNKAALVTKGVQPSDKRRMLWAAGMGTATHDYVEPIIAELFPDWHVETKRVTAKFPNGAEVTGTPDILVPEWNGVFDVKSVDGFSWVKRYGCSQNHRFQRATYALGACQEGLLDDSKPVYVANIYFDRSGKEQKPLVLGEELNWSIVDEISAWIDDVIYAVKNGEDAPRDVVSSVCEQICEFYSVCRGGLPADESALLTHPDITDAVALYVDGRQRKKEAEKDMDAAKTVLSGLNGSTGEYQVRTTHVPASDVAGFTRGAYDKVEVVKVRRR